MVNLKVIKKEKEDGKISYYAPITNEFNGKRTTYYLGINFKKGIEPENTTYMDIKNFFFSSYYSNGEARLKIVVMDYEIIEKSKDVLQDYNNEKETYADFGDIQVSDDDIAF